MFFIFNKDYRAENKFFSELTKQIRESKSFSIENKGQEEIYHLDNMKIVFNVIDSTLAVFDKSGKEIITLNCKYNVDDSMQKVRSKLFHHLLCEVARGRAEKQKQEKTHTAQETGTSKNVADAVSVVLQDHWQIMSNVLEKIRGL